MQFIFVLVVIYIFYLIFRKKNNKVENTDNVSKNNSPVPTINKPVPKKKTYTTYDINLSVYEDAEKFYKKNKIDELEENDDYSLTKKELFEEVYSTDKIYRYLPLEIECKIVDNHVYDADGMLIGDIDDKDMHLLEGDYQAQLYFNEGSYKFVDSIEEEIERVKGFSWFDLIIKKEEH